MLINSEQNSRTHAYTLRTSLKKVVEDRAGENKNSAARSALAFTPIKLEFFLPEEFRADGRGRAQCSQELAELLSVDVLPGQCGRLIYGHIPNSTEQCYVLNFSVPASLGPTAAERMQEQLLGSMLEHGFAARAVREEEYARFLRSIPNNDDNLTVMRLVDGPDGTDPEVTKILREVLEEYSYLYLLDFKRLRSLDPITKSAQCLYGLDLVIPESNKKIVSRVQDAFYDMYSTVAIPMTKARKAGAIERLKSCTSFGSMPHLGHAYTVADMIPY